MFAMTMLKMMATAGVLGMLHMETATPGLNAAMREVSAAVRNPARTLAHWRSALEAGTHTTAPDADTKGQWRPATPMADQTWWEIAPGMIAVTLDGTPVGAISSATPVASLVQVGDTFDACDRRNLVTFTAASGSFAVAANTAGSPVRLPSWTNQLYWYCGGVRERCANGNPFNWIHCQRAGNGAIHWIFYSQ